jgi:hypothetical protein
MLGAWPSPTTKTMNLDGIDSRTEDARAWTPIAALETATIRDSSPLLEKDQCQIYCWLQPSFFVAWMLGFALQSPSGG